MITEFHSPRTGETFADFCRRMGWGRGTILEGRGGNRLVVTALGDEHILARFDTEGAGWRCEGLPSGLEQAAWRYVGRRRGAEEAMAAGETEVDRRWWDRPLTRAEREVYEFLVASVAEHGHAPSRREIDARFGVPGRAGHVLHGLRMKGWVGWTDCVPGSLFIARRSADEPFPGPRETWDSAKGVQA